ncbi:MAG: histidinol-phosphatase, partial [Hyphomicrobiales bacterium]|nr:histidinol-phosphatase [Hyphomicrobiales bacterium]
GIVGEEYGNENENADYVWVLDPIDGTRSFISGMPVWGVLIGLLVDGKPRYGMMSQPFTGERFFGDGDQCRYQDRNGARLVRTRPCKTIAEASLFTTSPDMFEAGDLAIYERLSAQVRLRRYGMDCYAYCMLASGFVDIVAETGLSSFDILPLVPIVESAGGRIVSWTGDNDLSSGRVVTIGDPALKDDVVAILAGRS